jgi:cell division protein FtsQ
MRRAAKRAAPTPLLRRRRRITPALRRAALLLLPIVLGIGFYAAVILSRLPVGQAIVGAVADRVLAGTAALGLVVSEIEVEGRETTDAATIMAALQAGRGTPILAVSPSRAKQQLESLPWVRSAAIERRLPGTLWVRLVERHPLAVWQHGGKQELIDREGAVIPVKDLGRFSKVPTVVGDDAARYAATLIAMLANQPELAVRVTAAIRVDARRWNLRIDNAIDIMLPEEDPAAAWARLAALEHASNVLKRDIQVVDMRLPDRVVLRVSNVSGVPLGQPAPIKKAHAPGKST